MMRRAASQAWFESSHCANLLDWSHADVADASHESRKDLPIALSQTNRRCALRDKPFPLLEPNGYGRIRHKDVSQIDVM